VIDVVKMVVGFVAKDADILLTLVTHCQVATLPVDDAGLPFLALEAGVAQIQLFFEGQIRSAFSGALPLADLIDVSFEYLVLSVVVTDLLLLLQLLLKFLLLPERNVLLVRFLVLDGCGQLGGIYL
jgi:hypothetical protein